MQVLFKKVTIIGVGLIGGSLGMALASRGLAEKVTGVDIDPVNLELALELEAIHEGSLDAATAVSDADLVVIACPVGMTVGILREIAPFIKPGSIVTDVGSTKDDVVREAEEIMPQGSFFVGGHPMTGSEIAGVKGADRYLFENAVYILTPTPDTDPKAKQRLQEMVDGIGAKVLEINPGDHDMMVAAVSHLPHLVATALVNTAGLFQDDYKDLLMLAAGGFRDTTRVASGHPLMWKDICRTNRKSILRVLDRFAEVLQNIRGQVDACDDTGLEQAFENARRIRNSIPSKLRGYLPQAFELVATVPDKPGVIACLAGLAGEAGININDIEILRVREGEGGTIRLAFGSDEDRIRALEIYRRNGITVKRR